MVKKYSAIVKGFTKIQKQLELLAAKNVKEAEFKHSERQVLTDEIFDLKTETDKANKTIIKLKEIFG